MDTLKNTMSGMQVKTPADTMGDLPPEVLEAAQRMLSATSTPTQADQEAATAQMHAAYAPLLAQINNQQAPDPQTAPQADPMHAFLAMLSANIAGTVNPDFAEPAKHEFNRQQQEAEDVRKMNASEKRAFHNKQTDDSLQLSLQMTKDALAQAKDAGDDKLATNKALQMARINDALDRRRDKEKHTYEMAEIGAKAAADAKKASGATQFDPDELDSAVESVANGETNLTDYPTKSRPLITKLVKDKGYRIVPKKVREAINEVGSAESVVDEIARASASVNKAKAGMVARGIQGFKNMNDALNQTGEAAALETARGGLAGNLARAIAAERGVLTDQDRKYAMSLVPTLFDSEKRATEKIAMLRRFIAQKKERAMKSFMTPMQREKFNGGTGGGSGSADKDPLGVR